jgi:hypothetical protein
MLLPEIPSPPFPGQYVLPQAAFPGPLPASGTNNSQPLQQSPTLVRGLEELAGYGNGGEGNSGSSTTALQAGPPPASLPCLSGAKPAQPVVPAHEHAASQPSAVHAPLHCPSDATTPHLVGPQAVPPAHAQHSTTHALPARGTDSFSGLASLAAAPAPSAPAATEVTATTAPPQSQQGTAAGNNSANAAAVGAQTVCCSMQSPFMSLSAAAAACCSSSS